MIRPLPIAIALMVAVGTLKAGDLVFRGAQWGRVVPSAVAATGTAHGGHGAEKAPEKASEKAPEKAGEKAGGNAAEKGGEKAVAAKPSPPVPAAPPPLPPPPPPPSEAELKLLTDLRGRRTVMEGREQALSAREAVVAAAEQRLSARVGELESLQARLQSLETARREHDEANWRGLVRTYEAMKPKEAAGIMAELDDAVLLPVLDRMKDAKTAPILTAMPPDRARTVTAQLAQMRTRANTPAPAGAGG